MPNWKELLNEISESGSTFDAVRRKYLRQLSELTGRNTIIYYSGWLQKPGTEPLLAMVNDADKTGFMTVIHQMDRSKGLDLVLHTPGGEISATESLVDYLRAMFGTDIRAVIPQLAMSAGTMIACACKQIIMGKHSNLGPIDPQLRGIPAHAVIEEFTRAFQEVKADPQRAALWQPIIAHYGPTFVGECQKAIDWSEEMVASWLKSGMFAKLNDREAATARVLEEFGDHALTKSHSRHLSVDKCSELLDVIKLEDPGNEQLQDAVLTLHHACIHTLTQTPATKIIENQMGVAFIQSPQVFQLAR
jgi:ClpP class serine protease